ncbi:uncharacterized protein SPSK_02804 [Sporothrix schenckii 1099-18]|uniref:SnoaL-like domain-containing protein n=2 Tax=Sporothrix schenckii TaxID=29908 RepID=U7PRN3_SPOS1|nr:uncharacterized protein SPSK_02804 [Sporothrix schenckii 1099-18]ERS97130.1 hypothetical protein HMPREF1624_06460 [Sporothrix schenckii ATCC 58251]KJR86341.1 hypothetical protein SPSK_02804 [Sporothrix schenckii 1099-18]
MAVPVLLSGLTTREAIIDAMTRALVALDHNDVELFNSAWAGEDVVAQIGVDDDKKFLPNLSVIRMAIFDRIGPMDTTHSFTTPRVHVHEGADTAVLTTVSLAQHCPAGRGKEPDGPKYLVAGEYTADMVRDAADGVWKIKKWVLKINWAQGDASILDGPPPS